MKSTHASKLLFCSRKLPYSIHVYLDSDGKSSGDLYWDDGESLDSYHEGSFNYIRISCDGSNQIVTKVEKTGFDEAMKSANVKVYGVKTGPKSVTLNGRGVKFVYAQETKASFLFATNFCRLLRYLRIITDP